MLWILGFLFLLIIGWALFLKNSLPISGPVTISDEGATVVETQSSAEDTIEEEKPPHPMSIEALRQGSYPGGEFTVEQVLANGSNYRRLVASYLSEGLKIFGLLTVPLSGMPEGGYPALIFVHGHIPAGQYSTINSYPTYQTYLAREGYVTFKPDLRGHGDSEGERSSAHYSPDYVIDTLNAIAYLKDYPEVNPDKIVFWGHSNGGEIGLRTALISDDLQAASFWAGVVGSYEHMYETYIDKIPFLDNERNPLVQEYGLPSENRKFWNTLEPYEYLDEINIPIELQHATGDKSVPVELSRELEAALKSAGKEVEYIEYQGDDHNISGNAGKAWQSTIEFFNDNI